MPLKAEQVTTLLRDVWPPNPGWIGFAAGTKVKVKGLGVAMVGIPAVPTDVAIIEPLFESKPTGILLRIMSYELADYEKADDKKVAKKKVTPKKKKK
jgi:hypothetical protein